MSNEWKKVEMNPMWNSKDEFGNFKLKEGDEIIGILKNKEEGVGENESTVFNFKTNNGMVGVWGSTVLDIRLGNIEEGEEVRIVYLGKQKSKQGGRTYHNYDVFHRTPVITEEKAEEFFQKNGEKSFQEQIDEA